MVCSVLKESCDGRNKRDKKEKCEKESREIEKRENCRSSTVLAVGGPL
jgi:hypothetical protein